MSNNNKPSRKVGMIILGAVLLLGVSFGLNYLLTSITANISPDDPLYTLLSVIRVLARTIPILLALVILITLSLSLVVGAVWFVRSLVNTVQNAFQKDAPLNTVVDEHTLQLKKMNKILEYNKKREEIEEEITRLSSQLTDSSMIAFLEANHLIIQGQPTFIKNHTIDYTNFLERFGLNAANVTVKKDYAVFLSPFNASGKSAYQTCQATLNRLGILLQMTDNKVEKDDIMMNIVSHIVKAEFLIVNIDGRNPNVYYELGIAHAIGKPTILISNAGYPEKNADFDIRQKHMIIYSSSEELENELLYHIPQVRHN